MGSARLLKPRALWIGAEGRAGPENANMGDGSLDWDRTTAPLPVVWSDVEPAIYELSESFLSLFEDELGADEARRALLLFLHNGGSLFRRVLKQFGVPASARPPSRT